MLTVFCASAQKKEIATARQNLKKNSNLEQVEQSMRQLLQDSANYHNERIWLTLFEAVKKQYEQGNEKLYLKQKYDTAQIFSLTKKMFETLECFDSLQVTLSDGSNKDIRFRKKHSEYLNEYRANLFNGGLFFINKQKYNDAYKFFDMYIDCARQPLFSRYNYNDNDSLMPQAAYWAVFCGYKMQHPVLTLHHTYLALKDTVHHHLMLQYLAETYKLDKDTARYVDVLKEGFGRYPHIPFFFPRLVQYYADAGQWQNVLQTAESALQRDNKLSNYYLVKSTAELNLGQYERCISLCDSIIATGDSLPGFSLNAGLAYLNQAVTLDKSLHKSSRTKQKITKLYKEAMPYLCQYRLQMPNAIDAWGLPLYTIYLNLNMGKEFDEIDTLLRNKHN